MAFRLHIINAIPAPGEEPGSIQEVTKIQFEQEFDSKVLASRIMNLRISGELEELGEGWYAPKGAIEWAKEHPGKPILMASIEEVE